LSRFNKLLSLLKNGELSPKYFGRKDLSEYSTAGQLFDNMIPANESGFFLRGGTEFVNDQTTLANGSRGPALIKFAGNVNNEHYILAINPAGVLGSSTPYITVTKNDGTAGTISVFTDVEAPPTGLNPKGFVFAQIADVMLLTHVSGTFRPLFIARRSATTDDFAVTDYSLAITTENINLTQVNAVLKDPFFDTNTSAITITPSGTTGSITPSTLVLI